jgi:hypothetical protein
MPLTIVSFLSSFLSKNPSTYAFYIFFPAILLKPSQPSFALQLKPLWTMWAIPTMLPSPCLACPMGRFWRSWSLSSLGLQDATFFSFSPILLAAAFQSLPGCSSLWPFNVMMLQISVLFFNYIDSLGDHSRIIALNTGDAVNLQMYIFTQIPLKNSKFLCPGI